MDNRPASQTRLLTASLFALAALGALPSAAGAMDLMHNMRHGERQQDKGQDHRRMYQRQVIDEKELEQDPQEEV